ncbi:MAG TPA: sugar transferase [Solirubrobacteraceae bacterium]|jgi:exopolysaccharide biosynthesis polyprenyl glycosylphosphotransferase|nr:sugar transferase [Solirubrobacteraceae bacterium]
MRTVPVVDRGAVEEGGVADHRSAAGERDIAGQHAARGTRDAELRGKLRGSLVGMRRDALFRRMLLAADVLAVVGAFQLTVLLSSRSLQLTWMSIAGIPILVVGAKILGLYDRDEMLLRKTTLDEAPKLFHVATLCALVAWLAGGLVLNSSLYRPELLFLWLALFVLLLLARAAARALALRVAPVERCLFIGDASAAKTICSKLTGHGGVKAEVVAQLNADEVAFWTADALSADRLLEIRDLAHSLDVHRAIIAPGRTDSGEMLDLVRTLKAVGVRVSVLPRVLEVVGSSVEFDDLHGVTVMGVRRFELTRSSAAVKRAFDILGASIALVAVGPLMALIALAIKLDSRGPVFFRQLRVGQDGERFYMFKFRTMVRDADELKDSLRELNEAQEGLFKIARDPRITRVGGILRKCALDELPQLFDVLRGEMSLVGPRPLVVDEDERIRGWYRRRLELMPGMTGPWQILGPARVPLQEMVAIDYLYVANWSLWGDIKIMLRTVPHVIGRRGL